MNAWRGLAFGLPSTFDPHWAVLSLLFSGLIAFLLAIYLFSWDNKNRRKGRSPYLALFAVIPYILAVLFMES